MGLRAEQCLSSGATSQLKKFSFLDHKTHLLDPNHAPAGRIASGMVAGVDISKPRLDVFNLESGEVLEFENNPVGIKKFVKYAKKCKPTLITS